MLEQTSKLIQLLKEGKSCNEISSELNISNRQLYNRLTTLKNKGLLLKRKYYSTGDIIYRPVKTISEMKKMDKNLETAIITTPEEKELKCIIISDLHFGNSKERTDLMKCVYEYCAKNNIHIILGGGDMIDGTFNKEEQSLEQVFDQIEYFLKNYPFDKSILNFWVGGNHDIDGIYDEFQDILKAVENYRHDIIAPGYNNAYINIKNDQIHLFHHILGGKFIPGDGSIVIHGHAHKYATEYRNNLCIAAPSLSEIGDVLPTAIEMTISFERGIIREAHLKQLMFMNNKTYIMSEVNYDLDKRKEENVPIKYEERRNIVTPSILLPQEAVIELLNTDVTTSNQSVKSSQEDLKPTLTEPRQEDESLVKNSSSQEVTPIVEVDNKQKVKQFKIHPDTTRPANQIERFNRRWGRCK